MAEDHVRRDLLLKTGLEILRDTGTKVSRSHVMEVVARRLDLTPYEWTADKSGLPRYDTALGFMIGDAATLGWASKLGGWSITDAGIEALDAFPDKWELWTELTRRYREIDQRRKQAMQSLNDVQAFIATTLQMVEPGSWTAHDDLAEPLPVKPVETSGGLIYPCGFL
jgi:5-methylcytosine-specific restriction enzyme B